MSHVADCEVQFKDMSLAGDVAKALGGEYLPNETKIRWYGRFLNDWNSQSAAVNRIDPKRFGKTDAGVIRFADCGYDIGFLKNEDGSYTPYYDSWGEGHKIANRLGGISLPKLNDEYAAAVSTRMLARRGFRVQRSTDAKGAIVLNATN